MEQDFVPVVVDVKVVSYQLRDSTLNVDYPVPYISGILNHVGLNQFSADAPHFVYIIRVSLRSPEIKSWEVHRRFSQLAKLDTDLSSMTKFLPFFPPRSARRDLTDICARERTTGLNQYLETITKMEEVVTSPIFQEFFNFPPYLIRLYCPRLIADICPTVDSLMRISSICLSDSVLVTTLCNKSSVIAKVGKYISSLVRPLSTSSVDRSRVIAWRRLPNSFLFERLFTADHNFRIACSTILDKTIIYGSSDGRVGFRKVNLSHRESDDDQVRADEEGFLPSLIHAGQVTAIYPSGKDAVWTAGEDGLIQLFSMASWEVEFKMNSNSEVGVFVTSIVEKNELLYLI